MSKILSVIIYYSVFIGIILVEIESAGQIKSFGIMDRLCNDNWRRVYCAPGAGITGVQMGCYGNRYTRCTQYWATACGPNPPNPLPPVGTLVSECITGLFGK